MPATTSIAIEPLSENLLKKCAALKQKKYRDLENAYIAEGVRLCEEAIAAGAPIRHVIVTEEAEQQERTLHLLQILQRAGLAIHRATPRQLKALSDEKTPQGLLFIVEKPIGVAMNHVTGKLIMACENIQDPGNLGSILRTAEWFGVQDILLSDGCVDPYNAKVVRGSMGAIFRLNIYSKIDLVKIIAQMRQNGYRAIGTAVQTGLSISAVRPAGKDILIVGNEANGISAELLQCVDLSVSIPGQGCGESLNAAIAAAICLYHFSQHE
ncbi:RNA methyltransferase [candidate division KSB1 bacterium]|nr:RNA methyltransferase [candidate division KSB1 bacterium]